jgi:aminoglycoside phosphotransferase family enzyme/gluconate kinase
VGDTSSQRDVIEFLSNPGSYGSTVRSVDKHETHGSIVFLAGERAYKLKRAVRFPYMDYSTVAQRRRMCVRELEVNRHTAPLLYLGVCPVVRNEPGSLCFGTEADGGSALDWVVVMQRFDQDALLEKIRVSGKLTRPLMRLLAETIAEFHRNAEITPGFGGPAGIRAVIEENVAILKAKIGQPFDAELVRRYETESPLLLARMTSLLEARRRQGRVRRCHGDLHLNNICMIDNRPVLFDAIEFSDNFACIDVLYDLAFLLMDLDRHGLRDHANTVLNRYLEATDEYAGLTAVPLFLSCRAAVRAHTAVAAADTANDANAREAGRQHAAQLLERALGYLAQPSPRLIAVGGVSGTGKTTLARDIAPLISAPPGAIVIRSDIVRKQLMGVSETVRLPESAYAQTVTARVYSRIAELAATTLASGYSVIADAVYGKESERRELAEIAELAGVPFDGLWLEAPPELLESRIRARSGDASDATVDVLHAQLQFLSTPQDWVHVSALAPANEAVKEARRVLGY